MRVLQISADRSKRGILFPNSSAFARQEAYAKRFGNLDVVGFSLKNDGAQAIERGELRIHPTNSSSKLGMLFDAMRIAKTLPRPDVVTAQDPFETGLVAYFVAKHFNVSLHVQVHTDFLSSEYARLSFLNRIRVSIAGFVLRRATRVRVVSERIKRSLETKYSISKPISVLPIFVDVENIKNTLPTHSNDEFLNKYQYKLLVAARNTKEKNIQLAIEAFKEVAPDNACLTVFISDDHENIPLTSDDSRIQRIYGMDVLPYYKKYDLVLVTSKYEGYGLVIVEALAAGKPVLSTDVGIAREAGAIMSDETHFAADLKKWFKSGPRTASLQGYPYKDVADYIEKYCADVIAAKR